jgi:hypothetical protein
MSMVIGSATVVVVEHKHSAMHCDAYKGKLEAVLQMIDRGDIGGGAWYGCDLHKEALAKVEQQIAETRARIAEMEAEEAGAHGVAAVPMADLPGMARVAAMQHALTALEHAQAGLNWYGDRYPEAKDGSDDEADELIEVAIEGLRSALAAGVPVDGPPRGWPAFVGLAYDLERAGKINAETRAGLIAAGRVLIGALGVTVGVRLLTREELNTVLDKESTLGDPNVMDALQIKFCEVNGLTLGVKEGS